MTGVDQDIRAVPHRLEHTPFELDPIRQRQVIRQWMPPSGFRIALDQHTFVAIEKDRGDGEFVLSAQPRQLQLEGVIGEIPRSDIDTDRQGLPRRRPLYEVA